MKTTIKELFQTKRFKVVSLSVLLLALVLGIGLTLALVTDATNKLTNKFEVGGLETHIEENIGTDGLKEPVIVNDGPQTAFIRARITVNPFIWDGTENGITIQIGKWDGVPDIRTDVATKEDTRTITSKGSFNSDMTLETDTNTRYKRNDSNYGWYYVNGWYYFDKAVVKGECTDPLFDKVSIGSGVKENFDLTIYQEAVVATEEYRKNPEQVISSADIVNKVKAEFESVNQN